MATLFDTDNQAAGYRLHYLEVYNWGTFDGGPDGKVWHLTPEGKHSLLTGGNGSGKTTLVDALVTLLVPNSRFHYNQSSESGSKRERDEHSYVKGAYGSLQAEGNQSAQTQYLRGDGDYSVVLAHFYNQGKEQSLTLVQVRWYGGGVLQKEFLIAHKALTITEHFGQVDPNGTWKKVLKNQLPRSTEWFGNSFRQYSKSFSHHFGLRGPQALNLFAKTTGVKVIGDLNEFIRQHMLEPPELEEKFKELRDNYDNLRGIHREIEKATEQLKLLAPVMEAGKQHQQLEKEVEALQRAKGLLPYWYASTLSGLLQTAIENKTAEVQQLTEAVQVGREREDELQQKITDLTVAISRDESSVRIKELEQQIQAQGAEESRRKAEHARYTERAQALGLPYQMEADDQGLFQDNRQQAQAQQEQAEGRLLRLQTEEEQLVGDRTRVSDQLHQRQADLAHLQESRTNIPAALTQVRQRLARHLQVAETELPFVGELLQVKEETRDWLSATERALRPLAQHLLIDEERYAEANRYVHDEHLQGHIRYLKVRAHDDTPPDRKPEAYRLIEKLTFLPEHPFCPWLYNYVLKHADYACVDTLADWEAERGPALLRNGMVKEGTRLGHQRDQRPEALNPAHYLLGWDIEDKIQALEEEIRELHGQEQRLTGDLTGLRKQKTEQQNRIDSAKRLLEVDRFEAINWKACRLQIAELQQEKERLLASSSALRTLEEELAQVKKQKEEGQLRLRGQETALTNAKRDLQEYGEQLEGCEATLGQSVYAEVDPGELAALERQLPKGPITQKNIGQIHNRLRSEMDQRGQQVQDEFAKVGNLLTIRMGRFANPSGELKDQFPSWATQTDDLGREPADFAQYQQFHQKLVADDLPAYQAQFAKELSGQVVDDVILFEDQLNGTRSEIKKQMENLNTSLTPLEYDTRTYIELVAQDTKDSDIQTFRSLLRGIIEQHTADQLAVAPDYRGTFDRIRELIDKMNEEEKWRQRVIDVRNWWVFSAHEKYRDTHETRRVYEDSGGLSAGQKAKLAYTILASALAYQFNISAQHVQENSLRFVVVDEAFSKVDEDNAAYAMKLFEALSLQVMIVTPLDKIHVVERMIHSVHYVQNKNGRQSQVYNLTMDEYAEEKTKWQESPA